MGIASLLRTGRLMRSVPATAAAALAVAALAGSGPAAAAAHRDGRTATHSGTAPAGTISTVAGGVGGPGKATGVALASACGATFGAGRLYVADFTAVRAVNPGNDQLTTPAGTGSHGPLADGARATKASVHTCGMAVDHSGNLVIANGDTQDRNRILVVAASTGTFDGVAMKAGHIYAVAGTGPAGFSGDGGPATSAELSSPDALAVDAAGNLVIADSGNNRIRVVAEHTGRFYGQAMTAGNIYTVAGGGTDSGNGEPATSAELSSPNGVAVDAAGNLVIADSGNNRIRVVAEHAGTLYGRAMTPGNIYTVAGDGAVRGLGRFFGDGGPATKAKLARPSAVAVNGAGNLLISDALNGRIRMVTG
jgi:sugar lactone lactonase YvrE